MPEPLGPPGLAPSPGCAGAGEDEALGGWCGGRGLTGSCSGCSQYSGSGWGLCWDGEEQQAEPWACCPLARFSQLQVKQTYRWVRALQHPTPSCELSKISYVMATKPPASPPVSLEVAVVVWAHWHPAGSSAQQGAQLQSAGGAALPWESHGSVTGITKSKPSTSVPTSSFMHLLPLGAWLIANVCDMVMGTAAPMRLGAQGRAQVLDVGSHQDHVLLLLRQTYTRR